MGKQPRPESALRRVLTFLAMFLSYWFLTLAVVASVPEVERWTLRATIASLAAMAHLLRIEYLASGPYITLAGGRFEVVSDCTALMPTLALWCAILAFPTAWIWRTVGMIAGALALWIYNLARVLALAFVLGSHPGWFEFVHAYLWQTATLGIVLLMFIAWVRAPMLRRPA